MYIEQQEWSTFHHKYGSDEFRRSTNYDRDNNKESRRSLLKQSSLPRRLSMEFTEKSKPNLLRCSSTLSTKSSSSSRRLSWTLQAFHSSITFPSSSDLQTNSSSSICSSTYSSSVSDNKNAAFDRYVLEKHLTSSSQTTKKNKMQREM